MTQALHPSSKVNFNVPLFQLPMNGLFFSAISTTTGIWR
jgi:hypothetical protein